MYRRLEFARKRYVERKEKTIVFGNNKFWKDAEADEAVFRKASVDDPQGSPDRKMEWGQWAGMRMRDDPKTLVLWKTNSSLTSKRAPGPGAIKRTDWKPKADYYLKNRKIILHSDSARSYGMKIEGMLHDRVVHAKKRVKRGGKWVWLKPSFVRVSKHKLPEGGTLKTKAGTQIIDRTWSTIRRYIGNANVKPGSLRLAAKVRSAQWRIWNTRKDHWLETANMVKDLMGFEK